MKIESYQQLDVWRKAMALVTDVYRITKGFPRDEAYGLNSQARRSAVSIPANIAEGWGRNMTGEYIQFLRTARGSLLELETHLLIAKNLSFIDDSTLKGAAQQIQEISRMLNAMIRNVGSARR